MLIFPNFSCVNVLRLVLEENWIHYRSCMTGVSITGFDHTIRDKKGKKSDGGLPFHMPANHNSPGFLNEEICSGKAEYHNSDSNEFHANKFRVRC